MRTCPDCGGERPARFARCGYCGRRFADVDPMPDVSRTVTVLASDLQGSTALGERLDQETLREVLDLYFDAMRLVLESHGGTIEKIIGDAILAIFGLTGARADHALGAVRAAAEGQAALLALNAQLDARWGIQLVNRTGIGTGVLVVRAAGADGHILTGDVVPRAGRLEQSAPPLGVVLDEPTYAAASAVTTVVVEPFAAQLPNLSAPSGDAATTPTSAFVLVSIDPTDALPPGPSPAEVAGGRTCPNCATANPDEFLLCGQCGARLESVRAMATRKTVTIVFADLDARRRDGVPLPAHVQRDVITRAFDASRVALARHGGTIEKFIGDAVMAVFGLPVRHEDDALRAVRAALEMRAALADLASALGHESGIDLAVAVGVNTGEVITGEASLGQRLVTGDAVNVAARLEQAASASEILVGDLTATLVRDAARLEEVESLTLKGKAAPVRAHRLLGMQDAVPRRPETRLVGREREMRLLTDALDAAEAARAGRIVTIVGDAGVGKSRLAQEFLDIARGRATIVRGRCLPYGDGITFWPIVEVVRDAAGLLEPDTPAIALRKLQEIVGDDEVVERVAAAVGLRDAPFPIGELFWGIRRFLEILAAGRPLVVVFDDIHWAEPTFLDLLGHLVADAHSEPILLLCTARNELLEKRPTWGQAPDHRTVLLAPLSDADSARMTENLLGRVGLATAVRDRVVAAAEGNPLFVEQLVAMLRESGKLRLVGDRWEPDGDLSGLAIPPTIHALLAARLDQLPVGEREVVDPASVIGLVFTQLALQALVEDAVREHIPERLDALTARQLVRPVDVADGENAEFRFGHMMIRDAAYNGLLKRQRARLHERFVAWADDSSRASDRSTELEEICGYHLEQAHRYLRELGPLDAHGLAIGVEASSRLASAGRRAYVRGDLHATENLARRASALLPIGDPRRPPSLFRLGLALKEGGDRAGALDAFEATADEASTLHDEALATTARLEHSMTRWRADPTSLEADAGGLIESSIARLERLDDAAGLQRAWLAMAEVRMADGRWGAAAAAMERVIEQARRAEDRVVEVRAGPSLALCALLGPTPVHEAIRLCQDVMARSGGDRTTDAMTLRDLAHLHAMVGEFETARAEYRAARAALEELGWRFQAALTSINSGPIELLAGDPVAAELELRRDHATLEAMGDRNYIATVDAYLAEALLRQGRRADAATMASLADAVAAPDDVATQVAVRCVRAKLAALDGREAEAGTHAEEAVELSRSEDDLIDQAAALSALAEVRAIAGRTPEAVEAGVAALSLHEAKGDTVSAAAMRRWLAEHGSQPVPPPGP